MAKFRALTRLKKISNNIEELSQWHMYIEETPRLKNKTCKPISQNRKIHQIISSNSDDLLVLDLSCYIAKFRALTRLKKISNNIEVVRHI
jgi:ribosomal protein S21